MSALKDPGEVHRYIGGIFEEVFRDPSLRTAFAKSGVVLKLRFHDPDTVMVVDMVKGEVRPGDPKEPATVEISTTGDVGHRFWLGQVNISLALMKGEMRAKGPIDKIIKLVPLARQVFPKYREMLARSGRDDLLES